MTRPTSAARLLVLLLVLLAASADGGAKRVTAKLEKTTLDRVRLCAYGPEDVVEPGKPIRVGVHEVTPKPGRRELGLHWEENGHPRTRMVKEKKDEQTFRIGAGRERRTLAVRRDRFGRLYFMNPEAMLLRVEDRVIVLVDRDFDGDWLEPGVDLYGLPESRYLVPFAETIHVGARRLRLVERDLDDGEAVFEIDEPGAKLTEDARRIWGLLNDVRLTYGLVPTELDEAMSAKYCQRHADWMAANGKDEHEEVPGTPLYSKEGSTAGLNCLVGHDSSWSEHLFGFFDTPLHGYELASPTFTRTAIGERKGYVALWFTREHGMEWPPTTARLPAVFPPHEATGIPVSWWDEIPDPREGDPEEDWGYPIRIYVDQKCGTTGPYPSDVRVTLRAADRQEPEPVQIQSDPESVQPHVAASPYYVEFVVMPRRVLRRNTLYVLEASWKYEGEHRWRSVFTTGTQRGTVRGTLERGR